MGTVGGRHCTGVVGHDRKEKDTLTMPWAVSCTDGVTASGKLTMKKINGSTLLVGEGQDSRGRNVAMTD